MLILDKISLQISQKIFTQSTRKYIRIGSGINNNNLDSIATVTKNPGKIINETAIQWQQNLALPIMYNKQYQFQIFQKHQFGYNPNQFQNMMHGIIIIKNSDQKFNNWQVLDYNQKKIGFLSTNITSKSYMKNSITNSSLIKYQNLFVKSIVVHLPSAKFKKAFAIIKVGKKNVKTTPVQSRSGELVFLEGYQLQKNQDIDQAIIEIHSFDQKNNTTTLIASGTLRLDSQRPQKKVFLGVDGENVGEAYVECQQSHQSITAMKSSRLLSKSPMPRSPEPDTLSAYGISRSLLTKKSTLGNTQIDITSSRIKKVSVVHRNNDIVFPKQKRFTNYEDKQSQIVSYLGQRDRDFKFLNRRANRYYRGASLGFGDKTDFTKEKALNPGVGRYKLPSIWDRY